MLVGHPASRAGARSLRTEPAAGSAGPAPALPAWALPVSTSPSAKWPPCTCVSGMWGVQEWPPGSPSLRAVAPPGCSRPPPCLGGVPAELSGQGAGAGGGGWSGAVHPILVINLTTLCVLHQGALWDKAKKSQTVWRGSWTEGV